MATDISSVKSNWFSNKSTKAGSPGLVVMGGDSSSEGRGFESQLRILDGDIFSHVFAVKIVLFV